MTKNSKIHYHKGDLPKGLKWGKELAIDTETMGLKFARDRLCVVQLSKGDGTAHIVQLEEGYDAPNLIELLSDEKILKIFHFGRFDIAMILQYLGVLMYPVFCTKIASRLSRTNTPHHGLKNLCKDLLNIELSKQHQTSDWGAEELHADQLKYAASDVLYLHQLKEKLEILLKREERLELATSCFEFLPTRAILDLEGFEDEDVFSHSLKKD